MKKFKFKLLMLALLLGLSSNSWAQTLEVSGVVVDDQNLTIPGVSVILKGTTTGTVTDIDGKFALAVKDGAGTIVFSFVGFEPHEIILDGKTTSYNVQLATSTIGLDEVVAIGYGSVKKSDLTGSVASISAESLTEMRKTDIGQAVQGRISGVDVRKMSSKPGAPLSIKIRGNTVITNNNVGKDGVSDDFTADASRPLYVVDGIFMDDIDMINPSDIEKMDILKDASATAIYGSRGANGVVIITTKSGVEGKTQFTYDGTFGINSAVNVPDMYDGDEYVAFVDDFLRANEWKRLVSEGNGTAAAYNGLTVDPTTEFQTSNEEADNVANRRYTDWADDFRKTGIQTSHTVGMSGGQDGLVYNASIGYLKDEGVIGIEQYERYNATASISKKVTDKVTVGIKTYFGYSEREEGSKELFRSTLRLSPTVNSYNPEGEVILLPDDQDQRFINPIYDANGSWTVNTRKTEVIANFYVDVKPTEWFNFKSSFAPNLSSSRYGEYRGLLTKAARNDQSRTRAYYRSSFDNTYSWDNIANFDFSIQEGHDLKATVISSLFYNQFEGSGIENRNFDSDSYSYYNISNGTDKRSATSYYSKETIASFAARLNYNMHEKYLFTFTGRYDGSSKLAEGHKWEFFPSAAFAWRLSEEDFAQDVEWLDNLKVRLSYGESGNDKTISPYNSMGKLSDSNYLSGSTILSGKTIANMSNDQLGWEISKEYNLGFDLGVFSNKVRLSAEYYNKKTEGSILSRELMYITGYGSATGNYGSVRNSGIEIDLNTVNVRTDNFTWETSLNFAKNVNEIEEIDGGVDNIAYGKHGVLKIGEATDAMYSYEKVGIWQLNEVAEANVYNAVPGMYKYADQNNDGAINSEDKVVIGSHSPDWIGGMTNSFKYKDFDMSVMVYTRQGVTGHSEFYQNFGPYTKEGKFNQVDLDYWTPNNQDGEYPMPFVGEPGEWHFEDMSFVKVGNIGLGYKVPKTFLNKLNISSCRLSLDIQNPFTFTDYKGPDPETGLQNSYGMAYSVRTVLFGLKLKL